MTKSKSNQRGELDFAAALTLGVVVIILGGALIGALIGGNGNSDKPETAFEKGLHVCMSMSRSKLSADCFTEASEAASSIEESRTACSNIHDQDTRDQCLSSAAKRFFKGQEKSETPSPTK